MKCSYFQSALCTSCTLLDKSYEATLQQKSEDLLRLFPHDVDKLQKIEGVVSAEESRNKAKLAVFMENGEMRFGFYDSLGTPKELERCPLHDQRLNQLLPVLKNFFHSCRMIPYDLQSKTGELKYIIASCSEEDILLRFVLRSKESLDRLKKELPELQKLIPALGVVTVNIQPAHSAILEGDEEIILSEQKYIWHKFDEFQLALGARSFFQVTPQIARKLYGTLADLIKKDRPASLLDLYCGVGAFSFYASRYCPEVKGIEISKEAIECAQMSSEKMNKAISFEALDVEAYLKRCEESFEAILVNPPRRGLNQQIIDGLKAMAPKYIYYSSCNAKTLQRDYHALQDKYFIRDMNLFDMFPYTEHYETLITLERK